MSYIYKNPTEHNEYDIEIEGDDSGRHKAEEEEKTVEEEARDKQETERITVPACLFPVASWHLNAFRSP